MVEYFKSLDKSKRMNVKYFSCDMNKTFIDIAKTYFPNAKIVVDRYHFIRQVYWALENVRKNVQKSMSKTLRRYYKRSRQRIFSISTCGCIIIIVKRKRNNFIKVNMIFEQSKKLRFVRFKNIFTILKNICKRELFL